jgi:hypothetical protein
MGWLSPYTWATKHRFACDYASRSKISHKSDRIMVGGGNRNLVLSCAQFADRTM